MPLLIVFIIRIILAVAIASYADKKGRSAIGWALFAIFIDPILGIILLCVLPDVNYESSREPIRREQYNEMIHKQENIRDIEIRRVHQEEVNRKKQKIEDELKQLEISGQYISDTVDKAYKLCKNGYITKEEYRNKRENILNSIKHKIIVQDTNDFIGDLMQLLDDNILNRDDIDKIKSIIEYKKKLMSMKDDELIDAVNEKEDEILINEIKVRAKKKGYAIDNIEELKKIISVSDYQLLNEYIQNRSEQVSIELQRRNIDINEGVKRFNYIKNSDNYILINEYINNNDVMYREEIEQRGLNADIDEVITKLNNIQVIDQYRKYHDKKLEKELIKRNLGDYI